MTHEVFATKENAQIKAGMAKTIKYSSKFKSNNLELKLQGSAVVGREI